MIAYPCAKINLGLNIVGVRPDGYHDLETVFYPVAIHDELRIETANVAAADATERCTLTVDSDYDIGNPHDNLVVRAYQALSADYALPPVTIRLVKRIPVQAGMGGGSSDCSFTLTTLDNMFRLGIGNDRLRRYAASLGADCPFFIHPQPCYAEGTGDRMTPLSIDLSQYRIAIVKPQVAVSTCQAFAGVTVRKPERCCRDIVMQPVETWRGSLSNEFEASVFAIHPELCTIKRRLYDIGALYASMTGSGSALYGIYREVPDVASAFPECFTAIV